MSDIADLLCMTAAARHSIRIDPGWFFVIAGLAVCVAAVLMPAQRDLHDLRGQLAAVRADEDQAAARMRAYVTFLDRLESGDPQLIRRLAAGQLNLVPAGDEPVLLAASDCAAITNWIDQTVPFEQPKASPWPNSLLTRLTGGPYRHWVLAGGGLSVFIGLLLTPSPPRGRRRRPIPIRRTAALQAEAFTGGRHTGGELDIVREPSVHHRPIATPPPPEQPETPASPQLLRSTEAANSAEYSGFDPLGSSEPAVADESGLDSDAIADDDATESQTETGCEADAAVESPLLFAEPDAEPSDEVEAIRAKQSSAVDEVAPDAQDAAPQAAETVEEEGEAEADGKEIICGDTTARPAGSGVEEATAEAEPSPDARAEMTVSVSASSVTPAGPAPDRSEPPCQGPAEGTIDATTGIAVSVSASSVTAGGSDPIPAEPISDAPAYDPTSAEDETAAALSAPSIAPADATPAAPAPAPVAPADEATDNDAAAEDLQPADEVDADDDEADDDEEWEYEWEYEYVDEEEEEDDDGDDSDGGEAIAEEPSDAEIEDEEEVDDEDGEEEDEDGEYEYVYEYEYVDEVPDGDDSVEIISVMEADDAPPEDESAHPEG